METPVTENLIMKTQMNPNVPPTGSSNNFTNVDGDNVQVDLNNPNECKNFLGEFNWNKSGKRMKINNYDSGHATSVLNFLLLSNRPTIVGGSRTASITWMTPFEQTISVIVT